jgi:hypothetical protein
MDIADASSRIRPSSTMAKASMMAKAKKICHQALAQKVDGIELSRSLVFRCRDLPIKRTFLLLLAVVANINT